MKRRIVKLVSLILTASTLQLIVLITGCTASADRSSDYTTFETYKDIPGITEKEIAAIQRIRDSGRVLTLGMTPSMEAFVGEENRILGFSALLCSWLEDLFDIRFELKLLEWDELIDGLNSGTVDFTGEIAVSDERRIMYTMTDPITLRTVKIIHKGSIGNSAPLNRPLRYGFLDGKDTVYQVASSLKIDTERVFIGSYAQARRLLAENAIDAFIVESHAAAAFYDLPDVVIEDFFPLRFSPVSLATRNPELADIITVIDKALFAGAAQSLVKLHEDGDAVFIRHKFWTSLDTDERSWLSDQITSGEAILYVAEYDTYPVCFYNNQEKEWQGIALDVLEEVTYITGLRFERANPDPTDWPTLLAMLERGDAALGTLLIPSTERLGRFLWPGVPYQIDAYALVSRSDFPNLRIEDIPHKRIGLIARTSYADTFREWFPDHKNTTEYVHALDAFDNLERGDIDLVMMTSNLLLHVTNYMERPGFKQNIVFSEPQEVTFGLHLSEEKLASVLGKALRVVDTETITQRWIKRTFDYRLRMSQERTFWLLGVAVFISILTLILIVLIRSRSEGKRLGKLVEEKTSELINASNAKSNFLANMSHEMRTPLTAVIGLTEYTLNTTQLDDETFSNLIKVYRAGETLLLLINDILDISKIEADKFTLNPIDYDVPSLLNDTITQSILYNESKPVKFILDINEDLPSSLHGDELRVKQILNNLLSNAFKFSKEGTVELSVRHERNGDDIFLTVKVRDTGIGIRSEDIGKLFTNYTKMEEETDRKNTSGRTKGTGLGLSISKKVAEMMDGSISAESEYGKGSLFTVKLRQKYINDSVIGPVVVKNLSNINYTHEKFKKTKMSHINLSYAKVLIVDDNPTNLDVAKGLMSLYGMEIDCVLGGQQAIDAIRSEKVKYNAIFMDHMMPEIDGIEAVRIIREEINSDYAKTIPIIALTANAILGSEKMFLSKGFQAFISKPIDLNRLDTILRLWVRNKDMEAQLDDQHITFEKRIASGRKTLDIPGVDMNKGIAHFGYSEDAFLDILMSYAVNTKPLIEKLRDFNKDNMNEYAVMIHGIKGSSYGIFANETGDKLKSLELAANEGNYDFVSAHINNCLDTVSQIIADIEDTLAKAGKLKKLPKDKPDEALLVRLKHACGSFDIDEIDSIMTEIESYEYTLDDGLAVWLRENINKGKYVDVKDRISALIKS